MNKLLLLGCVAALAAGGASSDDGTGGIAIPPKPAASDGQIVIFENVTTGKISPQNGVCGAPDKPGTAKAVGTVLAKARFCRRFRDSAAHSGQG